MYFISTQKSQYNLVELIKCLVSSETVMHRALQKFSWLSFVMKKIEDIFLQFSLQIF